uniref:Uncharacterized protein n=1 Tax=Cucumis melo TaxID=3656 RepID=A0A9I9E8Y5_CUCME
MGTPTGNSANGVRQRILSIGQPKPTNENPNEFRGDTFRPSLQQIREGFQRVREKVNRDVDMVNASYKGKTTNMEKKNKNNIENRRQFKFPDTIHIDFNSESKRNMEKKKMKEEARK